MQISHLQRAVSVNFASSKGGACLQRAVFSKHRPLKVKPPSQSAVFCRHRPAKRAVSLNSDSTECGESVKPPFFRHVSFWIMRNCTNYLKKTSVVSKKLLKNALRCEEIE